MSPFPMKLRVHQVFAIAKGTAGDLKIGTASEGRHFLGGNLQFERLSEMPSFQAFSLISL